MRIGIVTHYWLPHMGGVEVMAHEQATRLASRGHDIVAVSSAIGSGDHPAHERIRIERHSASDVLGKRGVPVPVPSPRLLAAWRRLPPRCDAIIVHGATYAHAPVTIAAARRHGVPTLLVQSNPHVDYPGMVNVVERTVDRSLGRWCVERATSVVSISRHTAAHVEAFAPRRRDHEVMYLGVDIDQWTPPTQAQRQSARDRLGVDGRVALTVRRLVDRNGVDLAVDAWRRRGLDSVGTLLVVGDGPNRSALEHLASGYRIRFLGRVSDEMLTDAYRAADLFVLPTRSGEGFGLAAAQAMGVGLPVVTTTGGAQSEVVEDGVTGVVVPVTDTVALGEAMRTMLVDPTLCASMGAAGRQRIVERFSWERSIDDLEKRLLELCSAKATVEITRRRGGRSSDDR